MLPGGDGRFVAAEVETADGGVVVRLRGELDVTVAAALSEQLAGLRDKEPSWLIYDMAAVSFLDCAAARVMLAAAGSVLGNGRQPVIRAAAPLVRRLLELSGLDRQCELAGLLPGVADEHLGWP